jgi:hypothetical protein
LSEDASCGEEGEEHDAGHREHQHLRAQSRAASIADEDAPCRSESKRRVVQHDAGEGADDESAACRQLTDA